MGKERLKARIKIAGNDGMRNEDFERYVSDLLEHSRLDGDVVIGIAKKIVVDGALSLSEKQIDTFINYGIGDHYYIEECGRCGCEINWSEMEFAATEYGNCSYCQDKIDKGE